ncbi:hypothetical protein [Parapedobacter indicus]|uniref:Uncharacterized protein n=1 Tax=Parapedobacter indicus TaxID=1477437 RepID=A0A1I3E4M8_9SPHI|nr:hypothetical protein [Parapedobacter indicus]PPL04967.1 hypothetical protein CLV26_101778 [Parapedobacter indicus]SFH93934.1 hypothetical protein SAMN05444682_101764 [Parapedobacter indicus]
MITDNPFVYPMVDPNGRMRPQMGITLRDHFAGQAMQGMLANPNNKLTEDRAAQWAYVVAEAMLRERERRIR